MKKFYQAFIITVLVFTLTSLSLVAQNRGGLTVEELQSYWSDQYNKDQPKSFDINVLRLERIAKATPDETFYGIGDPRNDYNPYAGHFTTDSTIAKTNQAYVWGLTQNDDKLFFGTGPNIHCLVIGGYLQMTTPLLSDCFACEFGASQFSPPVPPSIGDWRPARMFSYDTYSNTQTEITPPDPKLNTTSGIRSAGNLNGVVLLGGPSFTGGVNIFAFEAATGLYLGSTTMMVVPETVDGVTNIRKWQVINEVLYLGLGTVNGGSILKWTGDIANPFEFENVGNIDGQAAELAEHDGKLFVTTWPGLAGKATNFAGLWMSPEIPLGGLTTANKDNWEKVWTVTDYEPDYVVASTYGGGALKSFEGSLYWGTMHVPLTSAFAHFMTFPPANLQDTLLSVLGTYRAISVFKGDDFGTDDEHIDLLYGNAALPKYTPGSGWSIVPNNMGTLPAYGPSGIWNLFNNYTWTMETYKNELFLGTMDWSFLLSDLASGLIGQAFSLPLKDGEANMKDFGGYSLPTYFFGADLFRFPSSNSFALPVDINGAGNYLNYGIRTMVSNDDNLYLGTANPMNLSPEGGWEIIEIEQDNLVFDLKEFNVDLVTKNEPDETFYGIGDPRNNYDPDITHYSTDSTIAKHNQSYVWGMTAADGNAWMGTGPNVLQLVMGAYLQMPVPLQTPSLAAEFAESQFSPPWPDILGDWRPARVFKWDNEAGERIEYTPSFEDAPELMSTLGLRSAGTIGNLVILAGPNIATNHFGVNFFAFNNETGEFLGSHQILNVLGDPINNIRKWITYDGESYTGISGEMYGYVIKWTGNVGDPFQFEVVGIIDAAPAEFTIHEGRLVTSCWPGGGELGTPTGGLPSVWYSPVIEAGGLTQADKFKWEILWESTDYEVDPLMARMMAGGAIQSFDGKLYWGSMHVPMMAALAHLKVYFGEKNQKAEATDIINAIVNTQRAISIFRADNLGEPNEEIDLLYGEEYITAYSPYTGWMRVPNASGYKPLYGPSGFGSPFNNYTWTMSQWDNNLFIGTMDWSYLVGEIVPGLIEMMILEYGEEKIEIGLDDIYMFHLPIPFEGADLWRIGNANSVATPVSVNGLGNRRNYGIRTMAATEEKLYLGSANAMNLHPEGGWELYALTNIEVDFIANKPTANTGEYVTFFPMVDGFQLFDTEWNFPGGDPSQSSEKNPTIYYANTGKYDVSLDVHKLGETISKSKTEFINIVEPDEAQCMDFYEGWGGVSSYMIPDIEDIELLMDPMINSTYFGQMVILIGETGVFWPALNFNTLVNWDTFKGYKVKMTELNYNCMFGEPETTNEITLSAGLHYLPVLSMEEVSASELFTGAPLAYAYNLYNGQLYWPAGGLYTLETLYPGISYLIRLTDEHTFVFADPPKTPKQLARMPYKSFENPTTLWESPVNTGRPHIFSVYSEALEELNPLDVIGAFNGNNLCVGMSQVMEIRENLGLVIYGDDNTTEEIDGLTDGETITFKILEGQNIEREVYPVFDKSMDFSNGKYTENGFSGIKSFKGSPTGLAADEIRGLEIYPNPAKDELNVICPVQDGSVEITIYSVQGQIMLTAMLTSHESIFNISHFENGVYLIKIKTNDKMIVEQLIKK
ncbi:MAG: T9SS type A sorting domain-containing protein [Bacteroidales bacterium]|nr:T9SS type A sorting domain-containing protein [Bacteroidales bacterium]